MDNRRKSDQDAALPRAIAEHLHALGVAPALEALVAATSVHRSIASHLVEGDYVAISPGTGGHIAGYVHQQRLSLALPPRRADLVGAEQDWEVSPESGVTSYVRIPASSLVSEPQRTVAVALLQESLAWRAAGPQPAFGTTGASAPGKTVKKCEIHFTQMLGGSCEQCSD